MRRIVMLLAALGLLWTPASFAAKSGSRGKNTYRPKPYKPPKRKPAQHPMVRRDRRGRIVQTAKKRDQKAPCPTTGRTTGPCPGFAAQPITTPPVARPAEPSTARPATPPPAQPTESK